MAHSGIVGPVVTEGAYVKNRRSAKKGRRKKQRPGRHLYPATDAAGVQSLCQGESTAKRIAAQFNTWLRCGVVSRDLVFVLLEGSATLQCLTLDKLGCRVVQEALEISSEDFGLRLFRKLRGSIARASVSPYGNFVVQKGIQRFFIADLTFVVAEIEPVCLQLAKHKFGCRIISRLLEYGLVDERVSALIDCVIGEAAALVNHIYGHYVLQHILEHGRNHQKCIIQQFLWSFQTQVALQTVSKSVLDTALRQESKVNQLYFERVFLEVPLTTWVPVARNGNCCAVLEHC